MDDIAVTVLLWLRRFRTAENSVRFPSITIEESGWLCTKGLLVGLRSGNGSRPANSSAWHGINTRWLGILSSQFRANRRPFPRSFRISRTMVVISAVNTVNRHLQCSQAWPLRHSRMAVVDHKET